MPNTGVMAAPATAETKATPIADAVAVDVDYGPGLDSLKAAVLDAVRLNLKPTPLMSGSEFAEKIYRIGKHGSNTKLIPYQRGMVDAMCDPAIRQVTLMTGARLGKTESEKIALCYYMINDPREALFVLPVDGDAKDFAKSDIKPLIRNVEAFRKIKAPIRRGEESDTLTSYFFLNGSSLRLRGAASEDTFRRYTTGLNIGAELDAAGWEPDTQGDKVRLLNKRGESIPDSKLILDSTPTVKGASRIEAEFEKGDQRRYWVPCPHCGEMQTLKWGAPEVDYGLKWRRDDEGRVVEAWYVCEHNGCVIEEPSKMAMLEAGEWRAEKPFDGHASFHINTLYSIFPKASWLNLAKEWVDALKDPENLLQPFINTVLGETWENRAMAAAKPDELAQARTETYDAEVPEGVLLMTAFADVQGDATGNGWLQAELVGWGVGEESWHIDAVVIPRDPSDPRVWDELRAWVERPRADVNGKLHVVKAVGVDSGGHYADRVKKVTRMYSRNGLRWFATKGLNERKGTRTDVWPKTPSVSGADRVYMIGTQSGKDVIAKYLNNDKPGTPGYMHFPDTIVDEHPTWFQQLTVEKLLKVKNGNGTYWFCPKGARNEALDCRVGAYAVLLGLMSTSRTMSLDKIAARLGVQSAPQQSDDGSEVSETDEEKIKEVAAMRPAAPQATGMKKKRLIRVAGGSVFRR